MTRFKKKWIFVVLVLISGVLLRIYLSGARDWERGQEESLSTEVRIHYLDRVVRWYFPGNPLNEKAVTGLLELAQGYEESDPDTALLAYDSLRGAILSIRHVSQPFSKELKLANQKIVTLRSQEHVEVDPKMTLEQARTFHQRALDRSFSSDPFWSFLVEVGFFAWLISVIGWIRKGFDGEGVMSWRSSLPWIGAMLCSFSLWIVSLLQA